MSGSNIGEGLETTLKSASAFGAGNVSRCDYGIMETTDACALIITPGGMTAAYHAFGPTWECRWTLEVEGYVKVVGDAEEALFRTWTLIDEVIGAVYADQSLNSSACAAIVTSMDRPRDVLAEMHGNEWIPVYFTVEAREVI